MVKKITIATRIVFKIYNVFNCKFTYILYNVTNLFAGLILRYFKSNTPAFKEVQLFKA